jgi:Na+/H+ antiporter NhaD/arsenite permease-like protein
MLIEGVEKIHLIDMVGERMVEFTEGHAKLASLVILWVSSISTSVIGNVASAATFSKIVHFMIPHFEGIDQQVFWWALSFGTCLGGNLTILASATNVVAIAAGEKAGVKITFMEFLKFGFLIASQSLILASIYMMVRYF